ncbi:MAG: thioredoxin family protein [candidate division Zixibacteria bacterium]|nr:thioredoxin family protein [candidate division Zixibacteria bacterium]
MKIQILGTGCSKCSRAAQIMKETAVNLGLVEGKDFEFEKVTNIQEMMKYKVMFTPGIVINGQVVSSGKVPSTAEAQQLINKGRTEEIK